MKNIYTWAAKPAKRTLTVGDLKTSKGKRKFTQVTANSIEEASSILFAAVSYTHLTLPTTLNV